MRSESSVGRQWIGVNVGHKPIRSIAGQHDKHRCRRCWRIQYFSNFIPLLDRKPWPKGSRQIVSILHPYCNKCREQIKGKWAKHPGYSPKADRFFETILVSCKGNANARRIGFFLEKDDLLELWIEQQGKCAMSGIDMMLDPGEGTRNDVRASIDRINSSEPYMPGNIHLVCAIVNLMKNDLSYNRFIGLCEKIVRHQANKEDELAEALTSETNKQINVAV